MNLFTRVVLDAAGMGLKVSFRKVNDNLQIRVQWGDLSDPSAYTKECWIHPEALVDTRLNDDLLAQHLEWMIVSIGHACSLPALQNYQLVR